MDAASFLPSRPFDVNNIFKMNGLTNDIQGHLYQVYSSLAQLVLCSAAGAYVSSRLGEFFLLSAVGTFIALWWLRSNKGRLDTTRYIVLLAYGFLQGLSVGGLVKVALEVDPGIVVTATLGAATIFICFSGAAMLGKRREFLYLGGFLSSAVLVLFVLSLANLYFRSVALFSAELYIGLTVFSGYVVFDTQMIIESAANGNKDYIWHAVELFTDLVGIFVRLLIILLKKKQDKEEKRRRQQEEKGYRR